MGIGKVTENILKTKQGISLKRCPTCREEKDSKHFFNPSTGYLYIKEECATCNDKRTKERIRQQRQKQKEKNRKIKLEKIKNGEIKKCKKCEKYRKEENFEPGSKICKVCINFIKKIKSEAEEREKDLANRAKGREAFSKEKELSAEERAKRNRQMIEEFKNKKEIK